MKNLAEARALIQDLSNQLGKSLQREVTAQQLGNALAVNLNEVWYQLLDNPKVRHKICSGSRGCL